MYTLAVVNITTHYSAGPEALYEPLNEIQEHMHAVGI
jgi:hypothetical protein